ncbi:unnamed protein product [Dibothriocephalus latus]|uniref:CBM21 domain-containing protein n=1 Tax=Dibothriocephalus latus TaxID=60516 RepID=A0A3P7NS73_DIBLA|nr:unnamed protein product [Dibothriocephalus latus]
MDNVSVSASLGEADCPDTVVCSPQNHPVHNEHLLPDHQEVLVVEEVGTVNAVPVQSEAPSEYAEVVFREEHRSESVCHPAVDLDNADGDCHSHPIPVTMISVLHQQLRNGEITPEEHQEITESIVQSTIPRNLSDSPETRKPVGVTKLYAWEPPPAETDDSGEKGDADNEEEQKAEEEDDNSETCSASSNFLNRVLRCNVALENARVDSSRGLLTGTIRVKSLGYEKHVSVRISYNDWATFCDLPTNYVQDSHDGVTDRFSFSAIFPVTVVANEKVQFAIRYETHTGEVFWDNNMGENYCIICHAKATDMAGDGSWVHFL